MDLRKTEYVFFDLDGTITEPFNGITKAVEYSLSKYGIKVEDRKELKVFIGPPLKPSYMKYYGFDEEKAIEAVAFYREYYSAGGMYDCELYDGAEKLLKYMSKKYKLVLATSKPQPFAEKILEKFDLKKYFHYIVGATFDDKVSEKADVIRKALFDLGISADKAVMIGDRKYDILGAKENGLDSIGVLFGFGDLEELTNAGARYIAETVEDVLKFV